MDFAFPAPNVGIVAPVLPEQYGSMKPKARRWRRRRGCQKMFFIHGLREKLVPDGRWWSMKLMAILIVCFLIDLVACQVVRSMRLDLLNADRGLSGQKISVRKPPGSRPNEKHHVQVWIPATLFLSKQSASNATQHRFPLRGFDTFIRFPN